MRARVFAFAFAFAASLTARAQDAGAPPTEPVRPITPEPQRPPVPGGTPLEGRPPSPAPAPPPLAPPPVIAAPPEPAEWNGFGPPDSDAWPVEYVLRPQTLPAHTSRGGFASSMFLPDTSSPITRADSFHGFTTIGLSASYGATSRLEVSATIPRIVCLSGGGISGCSPYSRFNGAGVGLEYGVARTGSFQLALSSGLGLALTDPMVFQGSLEVDAKWLIARRVALAFDVWASKWFDAPAFYTSEAVGSGGSSAYLYVQATRHLLLFGGLSPNGALDQLEELRVAAGGGVSWTFDNGVEIGVSASRSDVLPRHAWDQSIPGTTYGLTVRTWL